MTTQTVLRHPSDTLDEEPVSETDELLVDEHAQPVLLLTGDAEIIRRIRLAAPRWWEDPPSQSLVSAIAVNYDREIGLRGTCGTDRARRLRDLATNPDLMLPEDTPADLDEDSEQSGVSQAPSSDADVPAVDIAVDIADAHTEDEPPAPRRAVSPWPVLLLALPAFVAVWSGWVGLGKLTGFGKVNLLPGIGKGWVVDTAITLPIGVEAYAAFALWVWLSGRGSDRARRFARASAIASLAVGSLGQIAYHLMTATHVQTGHAPWQITMAVAVLPVAMVGMGAALAHLVRADRD